MLRKWHKIAVAALVTAGFGGLAIAGTANGAEAPACNAPEGFDCIAIVNDTGQKGVHSFRLSDSIKGQCLTGSVPGEKSFYPDVFIREEEGALLYGFTSDNCGGNDEVPITRQNPGGIPGYQAVRVF